ncbi:MAG: hypothetical protein GY850_46820 [bacterium]|nr:hypothetical protein [bacterium]
MRLRFIWYPLSTGVPLLLILLSAMGYYYSASALFLRLSETIALIFGLIIVEDLLLRWLFLTQRRLVFEDIKRKKEAEVQKQDREELPGAAESEAVVIEESEINLDLIYEKNQKLLGTIIFFSMLVGLWWIWASVLPALNFLENFQLWNYGSELDGVRVMFPVTLVDLGLGLMVAIVTASETKCLGGKLRALDSCPDLIKCRFADG